MIIVHHLDNSRSQRLLWMLEELGVPYEIRFHKRDPSTLFAPAELKRLHPLGKAPLVEVDGRVLAESGAIIEYLVDKAGGVLGPSRDPEERIRYRFFLHYAEGSFMPPLLVKLVLSRVPIMGRVASKRIQPLIDVHLDFVEAELSQRAFFIGEGLSAADIMMSFPVEAARSRGGLDTRYPNTLRWLDNTQSRPAYLRALEKGGAYAYGPAVTG